MKKLTTLLSIIGLFTFAAAKSANAACVSEVQCEQGKYAGCKLIMDGKENHASTSDLTELACKTICFQAARRNLPEKDPKRNKPSHVEIQLYDLYASGTYSECHLPKPPAPKTSRKSKASTI